MATKYCDHGAYGAYAAIPTWGAAQDGDGTAIGVGTPSTAEIVFTGIASTGVISVLGQAITFTRVTDANTCANNLATAINASTAVATGPASFTTLSQVRNHLYARGPAAGAPAGTCQIMTRQASASHAGLIAVTHTLNNVSSPATVNFAGGTGGCWGFLSNTENTWASALVETSYGVFCAIPCYTGALAEGDVVKVRSGKTLTFSSGTSQITSALSNMGSPDAPVVFDIDDSTVWADGANPVLKLMRTISGNVGSIGVGSTTNTCAVINAKEYTGGVKSLQIHADCSGTSYIAVAYSNAVMLVNVEFRMLGTVQTSGGQLRVAPASGGTALQYPVYKNCRFAFPGENAVLVGAGGAAFQRYTFIGCDFEATAAETAIAVASANIMTNTQERRLLFDACRFIGFVSGSTFLPPSSAAPSTSMTTILRNCDMGNVRVGPSYLGSSLFASSDGTKGVYASAQNGTNDFSYEDAGVVFVEWRFSAGRPTLYAKLLDGVTPWSIFAVPSTVVGRISQMNPVTLPRVSKVLPDAINLPEATRTFTLNFLLESNLAAWTTREISSMVEYVDADGRLRTIDSYELEGVALTTSTAPWSSTTWNGQTWLKRSIVITTPVSVKAGSEVAIYLRLHSSVANDTLGVILDPEVIVA